MTCFFVAVILLSACNHPDASHRPPVHPVHLADHDTLWVNLDASVIRWKGTKFWGIGKHEGIIRLASGYFLVRDGNLLGGSFVIDMHTIEITDIPAHETVPRRRLRNHLMDDDFFAVEAYPTATFEVSHIQPVDPLHVDVFGDLTLRGVSNPISFRSKIPIATDQEIRALAQFTIDRQRWGVAYRGSRLTNDLVDDEIQLSLKLLATTDR